MEAFEALGVPQGSVRYVWANDLAGDPAYWATVVRVMKGTTLARMRRAMTIMGRAEDEADADMSKFLYPAMQVADIFHLQVDVAYGGLDQRHAHMLARDVAGKIGNPAPVALHTPLVPSLKGPEAGRMDPGVAGGPSAKGEAAVFASERFKAILREEIVKGLPEAEAMVEAQHKYAARQLIEGKMSKSDPDSGIFIHDTLEDVRRKLKAAHCPAKEVEGNPVIDLLRLVVWPRLGQLHKDGPPRFEIHRPEKFGGSKIYVGYEAVLKEYKSGALHPLDLKMGVADAMSVMLEPVRKHFAKHPEMLQFVQGLKRTR
jgi:tyrosyl-tRNA synthetase